MREQLVIDVSFDTFMVLVKAELHNFPGWQYLWTVDKVLEDGDDKDADLVRFTEELRDAIRHTAARLKDKHRFSKLWDSLSEAVIYQPVLTGNNYFRKQVESLAKFSILDGGRGSPFAYHVINRPYRRGLVYIPATRREEPVDEGAYVAWLAGHELEYLSGKDAFPATILVLSGVDAEKTYRVDIEIECTFHVKQEEM
jgi:hypothetical protein